MRLWCCLFAGIAAARQLQVSESGCPAASAKVPRIFHQIWIPFREGSEDVPDRYHELTKRLLSLHPNWSYRSWSFKEIDKLIRDFFPGLYTTWCRYDVNVKKHDAARIAILYKYGGVYLDHDFFPLRNIERMLGNCQFVVGNQEDGMVVPNNGFIAATPMHPLLAYALTQLPGCSGSWVIDATGPMFLRKAMEAFQNQQPGSASGVRILPRRLLYPIHYSENEKKAAFSMDKDELLKQFPDSFLIQLYDSNWWYDPHPSQPPCAGI